VQWACERAGFESLATRLHTSMAVPWRVLPGAFPQLTLEQLRQEVSLSQEQIWIQAEERWQDESRLTAWQSDAAVAFEYSGKTMQPAAGGLSPTVRAVRDALGTRLGVHYDSVLGASAPATRCRGVDGSG
jgi:hypothetical protein